MHNLSANEDKLFESTYCYRHYDLTTCTACAKCMEKEDEVCDAALKSSCVELKCDENKQVIRSCLRMLLLRLGGTILQQKKIQMQVDLLFTLD